MIIQILARKGSIAWRMSFDQLANNLYKNFPNNNLVAVYPYLYTDEHLELSNDGKQGETTIKDTFINDIIPANNIFFDMSEKNPEIAFEKIFQESTLKESQLLLEEIIGVLYDYPLELTQEIVLIHTRSNLIKEYKIYIAVNKKGFEIPKIDNTHKIMIILLSPIDKTTQSHLNILSQISRTVTKDNFLTALLQAKDFEELTQLMK